MHDHHKAKEMVTFAEEKAIEAKKSKVTKITVTVGESSGYSPESLRMYFDEVSQGTVCENAQILIHTPPAMLECPKCGEIFSRKILHYSCPKCGEEGIPSKTGSEVVFESIETE